MTLETGPHCPRCGVRVPPGQTFCTRCGAPLEPAVPAEDGWPAPPSGLTQIIYVLLATLGGLMALGGAVYLILVLVLGGAVLDTALSLAVLSVGVVMLVYALRAFQPGRWRRLPRVPDWAWAAAMVVVWAAGLGLAHALPAANEWVMPPLIVLSAWLPSRFFLAAAQRGLITPAGRPDLAGRLVPRHVAALAVSLSASLSTGLALLIEGLAMVAVMAFVLAVTQMLGDDLTVAMLRRAAEDPQALQRLEELIIRSPVALFALGTILVIVAPAIEELVKAIPLLVFARQRAEMSERTAILLGVAGGVGFAFAENVGYLSMLAEDWAITFWFRAAAAVMHGAASGFVGRAWYQVVKHGRWGAMLRDLMTGWGIHAFWNALALVVGWFSYRELAEGVLFTVGVGLVPLAVLYAIMARWGIWVRER